MFKRLLIANRGEVALRIIRACWEMDIDTIAIYSLEDKDSLHVKLADRAICVGPARASSSYLNMTAVLAVAKQYNADALHPGYGFLAENNEFAQLCNNCGIKFIGPKAETITQLGDKASAKRIANKLNIPVIPGDITFFSDVKQAKESAKKIGYPVVIKAINGGGGKGIRHVSCEKDFEKAFSLCTKEVGNFLGNNAIYIEKFIEDAKHIEVQILGDSYGNVLILGDRDCSYQKKNQKLVEEAPANALTSSSRSKIYEYSKRLAEYTHYENAGTVEFLLDKKGDVYFLEVNTRLQVEHPITELVTGIDIVKEQIKIAYGERIGYTQEDIRTCGHSIECRVNAVINQKAGVSGRKRISNLHIPGGRGIRVDSNIYSGMHYSFMYDSNIAKLIAHGKDRDECINIIKRGLCEFVIDGVDTNIDILLYLVNDDTFEKNTYNTNSYSEIIDNLYFRRKAK